MSVKSPDNPLSNLLRRTDPLADDPGLNPAQIAEMRRAVMARAPEKAPGLPSYLTPAWSVAVLLILALGVAWWPSATDETSPTSLPRSETTLTLDTPNARTGTPGAGDAIDNRKIQFETPGGTLVVWVLNPNFPS